MCLYADVCDAAGVCEHYTEIDGADDDPDGYAADKQRKEEFSEFVEAWGEYVREFE